MNDDRFAEQIKTALADRRPRASRELSERLEATAQGRTRPRLFGPAALAAAVAIGVLLVIATRPGERAEQPHVVRVAARRCRRLAARPEQPRERVRHAAPPQHAEAAVRQHAVEPRVQRLRIAQPVVPGECALERVLHRVLGLGAIAEQIERDREAAAARLVDEAPDGRIPVCVAHRYARDHEDRTRFALIRGTSVETS